MALFNDFYKDKTVLVTGHTGFKGSWLYMWLEMLGARVVGYALEPPTQPSNFDLCGLSSHGHHVIGDIRDPAHLVRTFKEHEPDVVIHLAAQSLVQLSVADPRGTYETNVLGTVNVLDTAVRSDSVSAVIAITSDKCYQNVGWEWGYRETDKLGGDDSYSASKACAELAIANYQDAGFQRSIGRETFLPIASARAGNVVGGGDWASGRLIPDIIRSLSRNEPIRLRNPDATRPWQHVLEPLSGYLWLGACLANDSRRFCSSWNFGPEDNGIHRVSDVVRNIINEWNQPNIDVITQTSNSVHEHKLLALDCSKSRHHLGWTSTWDLTQTLRATAAWYRHQLDEGAATMESMSMHQIEQYVEDARQKGQPWVSPSNEL